MKVKARVPVAVLALAVLAASCSSSPPANSGSPPANKSVPTVSLAPVASTTTSTTSSTTTTTTSTASSGCASDQLSINFVGTSAAAGTLQGIYDFQNTTNSPCTLFGYPGLQMLSSNGQTIPTILTRSPSLAGAPTTVTLAPNGYAYFLIQYPDATGYDGLTCPAASSVEFTAPNDYQPLVLSGAGANIRPFGGTINNLKCGEIQISAVKPTDPAG